MIDCIAPAAHAFELAVKWIWPPGAEPVQPQEIHVSVLLTGVHERKEFLIERLTSLEAHEGSGLQRATVFPTA